MSDTEDASYVVVGGRTRADSGPRMRSPGKVSGWTSTPVRKDCGGPDEVDQNQEEGGQISTVKKAGLQDDLIVDSGFEISTKDSPETRPTSSPARKFNYSRADIEVSTVPKAADKEPEKSDEQQAIWHQRLLSGLVLLVVLGACGFGLLLTLRHLEGGPGLEPITGKYRAILWAFERAAERNRLTGQEAEAVAVEDTEDQTFRSVGIPLGDDGDTETANVELNENVEEVEEADDYVAVYDGSFQLTAEEAEEFLRLKRQDGGEGNDDETFRLTEDEVKVFLRRKRDGIHRRGADGAEGKGEVVGAEERVNEEDEAY